MPRKKWSNFREYFVDDTQTRRSLGQDLSNEVADLTLQCESELSVCETESTGKKSTSPSSGVSDNSYTVSPPSRRTSRSSNESGYYDDFGNNHNNQQAQRLGPTLHPYLYNHQLTIPKRGGPGSQGNNGKSVLVFANHFPLRIKSGTMVNHYDVDIKLPWIRERRRCDEPLIRRAFQKLCSENPKVFPKICAFDGVKNFYTTRRLGYSDKKWIGKVSVPEFIGETSRVVILTFEIQLARSNIDISGAVNAFIDGVIVDAFAENQILNIVLSQVAREKCVTIGRNYFPERSQEGRSVDLPGGKSVWYGFFQAVNIGWKPMVNVDVANKPAVKGCDFINYMEEVLTVPGRGRDFPPQRPNFRVNGGKQWKSESHKNKLEKDIKGLKIRYIRPDGQKREWRCNRVLDSSQNLLFEQDDGLITVEEYFKHAYNYELKYPFLPCIHLGSIHKTFYIPAELCEMKTQPLPNSKKLGDEEAAQMIKKTAVSPMERKERIENSLRNISNTFRNDEYAKEFGLSVEGVMSQIQARVYDPPHLAYKDLTRIEHLRNGDNLSSEIIPFKIPNPGGKWDMTKAPNGIKLSFIDNRHLKNWAILDLANLSAEDINAFVYALYAEGDKIGYQVEYQSEVVKANMNSMNQVYKAFQKLCSKRPNMIIVLTRGKNATVYNGLKYEGDIVQKISTQFVQQKNIGTKKLAAKPATLHNILLKINSKLGGTNQMLHTANTPNILEKPVIIMGADVTHPASDFKSSKPSIAAVVGSMDAKASQYLCEIRLQNTGQVEEMISSMEEVTKKLLIQFKNKNLGRRPEKIIFYRDGVSEGQFLIVLNQELAAIRRACVSLDEDYNPPITYIVAQKRHKTRLFPVNPKDGVGRNQNVPPGTVVDHTITHPTEFSFFLASHEGIQGTTKPTSYHLLWDDADMKPDDIIKMTYYLCHTYARCERSVSYPAPTYYAHLAAFRARVHHDALVDTNRDTKDNRSRLEEEISLANYFM